MMIQIPYAEVGTQRGASGFSILAPNYFTSHMDCQDKENLFFFQMKLKFEIIGLVIKIKTCLIEMRIRIRIVEGHKISIT